MRSIDPYIFLLYFGGKGGGVCFSIFCCERTIINQNVRERTRSLFTFLCLMFLHLQWLLPILVRSSSYSLLRTHLFFFSAVKCCIKGFPLISLAWRKFIRVSLCHLINHKKDGNFFPLNFAFFLEQEKFLSIFLERKNFPLLFHITSKLLGRWAEKIKRRNFDAAERKVFNWIWL